MNLTPEHILMIVIQLVVVVLSIMVHEVSHGYMAYRLGDPTAKRAGRLTLNPTKHLDPFGSVLLPVLMSFAGGPVFAYAKPVPYNPTYFKQRKRDELLVAFAGPFSNLLMAFVGVGVSQLVQSLAPHVSLGWYDALSWAYTVGYVICLINMVLLFFNIIPLPPLDGSSIIGAVLPTRYMNVYYKVKSYSMFILLVLLFLVPMITPWDPLNWYMSHTAYALTQILVP